MARTSTAVRRDTDRQITGNGAWIEHFARCHALTIAALAGLAALAAPLLWLLPPPAVTITATAFVLFGVPHGAVDHLVARDHLRPIAGRAWFLVFSPVYLGLAGAVLALWFLAPVLALVLFLAVSILHFGLEDAGSGAPLAAFARGGLPIALPVLLHPAETARFFALLGAADGIPAVVQLSAWVWLPCALLYGRRLAADAGRRHDLIEVVALIFVFIILPPLPAVAFYFVVAHSTRHAAGLAARHDPIDAARGFGWASRACLPLTLMTFALGYLLFTSLTGTFEERFLKTVFWGLAALTVPHMLLVAFDERFGGGPLGR